MIFTTIVLTKNQLFQNLDQRLTASMPMQFRCRVSKGHHQILLMMVVIKYAQTATAAMIIGNFRDML
jgi:hypothetical protein